MTYENLDSISSKSEIGQWYLVVFFSQRTILTKTWYKTYDQKLLVIVKSFKTWRHYLEGYKYEVLVLTNYNNLSQFMDTKNLNSCQIHLEQKLLCDYFRLDYYQTKANIVADALFQFL